MVLARVKSVSDAVGVLESSRVGVSTRVVGLGLGEVSEISVVLRVRLGEEMVEG